MPSPLRARDGRAPRRCRRTGGRRVVARAGRATPVRDVGERDIAGGRGRGAPAGHRCSASAPAARCVAWTGCCAAQLALPTLRAGLANGRDGGACAGPRERSCAAAQLLREARQTRRGRVRRQTPAAPAARRPARPAPGLAVLVDAGDRAGRVAEHRQRELDRDTERPRRRGDVEQLRDEPAEPAAGGRAAASSISAAPVTNTTAHSTGSTTTAAAAIIHAASNRRPNDVTDSPSTSPPST